MTTKLGSSDKRPGTQATQPSPVLRFYASEMMMSLFVLTAALYGIFSVNKWSFSIFLTLQGMPLEHLHTLSPCEFWVVLNPCSVCVIFRHAAGCGPRIVLRGRKCSNHNALHVFSSVSEVLPWLHAGQQLQVLRQKLLGCMPNKVCSMQDWCSSHSPSTWWTAGVSLEAAWATISICTLLP